MIKIFSFFFLASQIIISIDAKSSKANEDANLIKNELAPASNVSLRQMMPTAVINKGPIVTSLASLLAVKYWQTKRYRHCCVTGRCQCGGPIGQIGQIGPGIGSGIGPGINSPPDIGGGTGDSNDDYTGSDQINSFRPGQIQVTRPTRPRPVRVRPFQRPQTQPTPTLFVQALGGPNGQNNGQQSVNNGFGQNSGQIGPNRWTSSQQRPIQFQSDESGAFSDNFDHIPGGTFGLTGRRKQRPRATPVVLNPKASETRNRRKRSLRKCWKGEEKEPRTFDDALTLLDPPPDRTLTAHGAQEHQKSEHAMVRPKRSPRKNRRKHILKNQRKNKNGQAQNGGQRQDRPTRRPPNPSQEKPIRTRRPTASGETNGRKIRRRS